MLPPTLGVSSRTWAALRGGLFSPLRNEASMDRTSQTALVLSGGNALGAYLAGAYEHLHRNNIEPDWIVGASIGAVTGAILAGNAPEQRLPKLSQFWAADL
jgi:predicted acylesterase/phospholipase RssA